MAARQADDAILAGLSEADRVLTKDEKARSTESPSIVHYNEDGTEIPVEEDLAQLRRISDSLPFRTYLIAYVELAERFSYYGMVDLMLCKRGEPC